MVDKSIEWLNKIGESFGHLFLRVLCIVLMVVSLVLLVIAYSWVPLICAGAFLALFIILNLRHYVEYEFIFLADELRVTTIYNRRRRKKKMTIPLAKIERLAPDARGVERVEYLCSSKATENVYALIYNSDAGRRAIVMQADEDFVNLMKMRRKLY